MGASASAGSRISRRRLLGGALAAVAAWVLAACGAPNPTPIGSEPPASPTASSGHSGGPSESSSPGNVPATPTPRGSPSTPPAPSPSATPSLSGLRERIAGLLVVGFRGTRLADAPWVRTALADQGLGGVILFDKDQLTGGRRNVASPAQVARLTAELRSATPGRAPIIAIDQEGGLVTRLSPTYGFPPVASEATIGQGTAAEARRWARTIARRLADAGVDLNLAPVVDLDVNPNGTAIGALGRSFSADPDVVVAMAAIEIRAHRAYGVHTTLKHFPGLGSASGNTDTGVVDVTATWSRTELAPFRRLIADGLTDVVMAGHVINRRLDPDLPVSLSPTVVTGMLRGQLGWEGAVITDDLQAQAIASTYGVEEAAIMALEAGDDLLLFANQQAFDPRIVGRVVDAVATAVASGRLSAARIDEALGRVRSLFDGASG